MNYQTLTDTNALFYNDIGITEYDATQQSVKKYAVGI